MESLGLYLLKSAIWLAGFTIVFLLVLRNERYFTLNRIYLLSGIIASILFPLYTWHYTVILPSAPVEGLAFSGLPQATAIIAPAIPVYYWFYLVGIVGLALRLIWQTGMVILKLRKAGYVKTGSVKLVRTSEYAASFSFFSFVFVNPSTTDIETKEIVNHESEHIDQRHWFDLVIVELLCMLQWFNPFVWVYARIIRQNHEYLADEKALQRTSNPAIYQATLLNQMFGGPVISLANSFSYSLNKKRFKMMKKKIDSPFRKLKLLMVLPFIAMVFYAFAKPEYISSVRVLPNNNVNINVDGNVVKGKVVNSDGKPWPGTSVVIAGSTNGAMTDKDGNFKLKDVPKDGVLVFSFVGYQTVEVKPDFENPMTVKMVPATVGLDKVVVVGYVNPNGPPPPPPPPPPTPGVNIRSIDSKNPPLFILDGIIIDKARMDAINPETIASINVLKDKSATDKYGEKGENGVLEITSKKNPGATNDNKEEDVKVIGYGLQKDHNSIGTTLLSNSGIRIGSFDPEKAPLFVLDGVTVPNIEAINPDDIASMEVLKGGSATDKYGDKAKNGVILITSKQKATGSSDQKVDKATKSDTKDKDVFVVVEQMPEFPGGNEALMNFIMQNIKYPAEAQKKNTQGSVIVTFVVNSNGKVGSAKVVRGVDPGLDAEALRVINSMPDWKPGKQRGVAVDVAYTMPIEFKLQ